MSILVFLGIVSVRSAAPGVILPPGGDRWAGGVVLGTAAFF